MEIVRYSGMFSVLECSMTAANRVFCVWNFWYDFSNSTFLVLVAEDTRTCMHIDSNCQ